MQLKATFEIPDKDVNDLTERLASHFEARNKPTYKELPANHNKKWTGAEEQLITESVDALAHYLATKLDRTPSAIRWAIRRDLGIFA